MGSRRTRSSEEMTLSQAMALRLHGAIAMLVMVGTVKFMRFESRRSARNRVLTFLQASSLVLRLRRRGLSIPNMLRILCATLRTEVRCGECAASAYTTRLVRYRGHSSDGRRYCEQCWRGFREGKVPCGKNIDEAHFSFHVLSSGTLSQPIVVSDIAFPWHEAMCNIHIDQLSKAGAMIIDKLDVFDTGFEDRLRAEAPQTEVWDLAIFSAPCGVLSTGERHLNFQQKNGIFVAEVFTRLSKMKIVRRAVVLFGVQHLDYVEENIADPRLIRKVDPIAGWTPRRSHPRSLAHDVCGPDDVFAIDSCEAVCASDVRKPVKILAVCAEAKSILFIGAGCAHLEIMVVDRLLRWQRARQGQEEATVSRRL